MTNTFEFFIPGEPAPGGSKNAFVVMDKRTGKPRCRPGTNYPIVTVSDAGGKANKVWRSAVAAYGRKFMMASRPFTCAMNVDFIFFLLRPMNHFVGGNRERGTLKDDAPPYHVQTPDALKYARAAEDALTGVIWQDDSQTVRITSEKRWTDGKHQKSGCTVRFTLLMIDKPEPVQDALPL